MNGFNPLGGLKEWHVTVALILAGLGLVLAIIKVIEIAIWCINHITIN